MGIFDRFTKQKITHEQWLDFAFNQLMSEKWYQTRKKFYDYLKKEKIIPDDMSEEFFTSSILGALLELLTYVTTKYNRELGFKAHLLLDEYVNEYVDNQDESIISNIRKAYDICNAKVGGSSGQYSGFRAIALGCSEHLEMKDAAEFIIHFETELQELTRVWLNDLGQYYF